MTLLLAVPSVVAWPSCAGACGSCPAAAAGSAADAAPACGCTQGNAPRLAAGESAWRAACTCPPGVTLELPPVVMGPGLDLTIDALPSTAVPLIRAVQEPGFTPGVAVPARAPPPAAAAPVVLRC